MKLAHYCKEGLPSALDDSTPFLKRDVKPKGLWVSAVEHEMSWREWCEGESYGTDCYRVETDVSLRDGHSVLVIDSLPSFDKFARAHRCLPHYVQPGDSLARYYANEIGAIDWPTVAENWDGIIIAPYQWKRRLLHPLGRWYYGWDCASGCIWNPRSVEIGGARPVQFRKAA